jgi:transposase
MTDAFGVAGREWLAGQILPPDERDTIDAALRPIDFLTGEITTLERDLAEFVLASTEARRLLTVPGVGMITAGTFLAQVGTEPGDINRFSSPRRLVGYLGLDPKVRQSGNGPTNTGRKPTGSRHRDGARHARSWRSRARMPARVMRMAISRARRIRNAAGNGRSCPPGPATIDCNQSDQSDERT